MVIRNDNLVCDEIILSYHQASCINFTFKSVFLLSQISNDQFKQYNNGFEFFLSVIFIHC